MAGGRVPATGEIVSNPGTLWSEEERARRRGYQDQVANSGSLKLSLDYNVPRLGGNRIATAADTDIAFLFPSGGRPAMGLNDDDYSRAAVSLGIEIAAIKAVAEVETSGKAFDDSGRPRILFERHYFHRLTSGKFSGAHPDISNVVSGGYGLFAAQYGKLERAFKLDPDAALRSASWGRFQIMGDNFRAAGFASVREFVLAMARSESEHLNAFTTFVGNDKAMLAALRKKDWATFAAAYNGPGYKKNNYDQKMADAYNRYNAAPASVGIGKP
jgi:hypothetical protein